jgi:hypothetical protein
VSVIEWNRSRVLPNRKLSPFVKTFFITSSP